MSTIRELPVPTSTNTKSGSAAAATILRMLFWPALGATLALVLLTKVVLPVTGVGSVERIVQLGRHLDTPFSPPPMIAFLGNSITREGIDARLVEETAPAGWYAQNLAISACGLSELRVQLPKVLAARPAAVTFGLRPEDLGRVDDFDLDKAYAYAMGAFVAAWPSDWTRADLPGVGQQTYQALRSDRLEQELHFRTAPLNLINSEVRLRFRKGLRRAAADDWTDPYELAFNVRDERLARHIDTIRRDMEGRLADGANAGAKLIDTLVAEIHRSGATPVLVVLPMHPLFQEGMERYVAALRTLLERIAQEKSGIVIDALDVLSAEEFADALHPNAEGRAVYSRFLGRQLSPLGTPANVPRPNKKWGLAPS
jgi:hypothetical protein